MPTFKFKGVDSNGVVREGSVEAPSRSDAHDWLARRKLKILSLQGRDLYDNVSSKYAEQNLKISSERYAEFGANEKPILGNFIYFDNNGSVQIALGESGATSKDIVIFSRQLSVMINSGLSIVKALELLIKQQTKRSFRNALISILIDIENGGTFSEALSKHDDIFDDLYVAMIRSGEVSGGLDTTLKQLVTYIEKSESIKGKVKSAMTYPIIVFCVATLIIVALMYFVVPQFEQQYKQSGQELPWATETLIDLSKSIRNTWYLYLAGIVATVLGTSAYRKTANGRKVTDKILLKFPGIGTLLSKVAIGRFCSTMANLLRSGVNLLEAITICGESSGNKVIEDYILSVRPLVETGSSLSDALKTGNLFPDLVISMIEVGESTGALDSMLEKVADFYEEEVDLAVQAVLSMIEPVLIVGVGGIIAFIVIALYLPIFDMANNM